MTKKPKLKEYHRFLDESGDTTFFGKRDKMLLGTKGVSKSFMIGMLKIKEPLDQVRERVILLQNEIADNPFYQVPSVVKMKNGKGYYLHAKNDLPEIQKEVMDFILSIDCSFEAVVARKETNRFVNKHKKKEEYFYADLLSHLLKNKLKSHEKLVVNVAERGTSTKNNNLHLALLKAKERFAKNNISGSVKTEVVFNQQTPYTEPLLNIADYFCWVTQKVFEEGKTRHYNYLKEKISVVIDLYDTENYKGYKNYYGRNNPLTGENKIGPP